MRFPCFKLVFAAIAAVCFAASSLGDSGSLRKIVILHSSDMHGHLEADTHTPGFLALIAKADAERSGGDIVFIDCGDSFQGSLLAASTKGMAPVDAMNIAGYSAWIPGNHDYDYGKERFLELSSKLKCQPLAANLMIDGRLPARFKPWTVFEVQGVRLAVIGMTSPHLSEWLWGEPYKGIAASQVKPSLDAVMPDVMKAKPDIIVLAVHAGLFTPRRISEDANIFRIATLPPDRRCHRGGIRTRRSRAAGSAPPHGMSSQAPILRNWAGWTYHMIQAQGGLSRWSPLCLRWTLPRPLQDFRRHSCPPSRRVPNCPGSLWHICRFVFGLCVQASPQMSFRQFFARRRWKHPGRRWLSMAHCPPQE